MRSNPPPPPPAPLGVPILKAVLNATKAFQGLTAKEQLYAYALGKADWEGAKICLLQCSPEAAPIFSLLQLVFAPQTVAELESAAKASGATEDEIGQVMMYVAVPSVPPYRHAHP